MVYSDVPKTRSEMITLLARLSFWANALSCKNNLFVSWSFLVELIHDWAIPLAVFLV
jgi:hypothetical protein